MRCLSNIILLQKTFSTQSEKISKWIQMLVWYHHLNSYIMSFWISSFSGGGGGSDKKSIFVHKWGEGVKNVQKSVNLVYWWPLRASINSFELQSSTNSLVPFWVLPPYTIINSQSLTNLSKSKTVNMIFKSQLFHLAQGMS